MNINFFQKKEIYVLFTVMFWMAFLLISCERNSQSRAENQDEETEKLQLPDFESVATDQLFVYSCEDSFQFTAHVTKDSTWLFLQDTTVKVLPVKSASGARYEGGKYLYWSKDNEAILQKPQGSFMICQSVPQERSWVAAKLRGVDFRALGQEPGWFLELKKNDKIRYVGNYGADTLTVATPDPQTDENSQTIYRTKNGEHILELIIAGTPCTDTMSGFDFPHTTFITVDGKTYSGCGRYLQDD